MQYLCVFPVHLYALCYACFRTCRCNSLFVHAYVSQHQSNYHQVFRMYAGNATHVLVVRTVIVYRKSVRIIVHSLVIQTCTAFCQSLHSRNHNTYQLHCIGFRIALPSLSSHTHTHNPKHTNTLHRVFPQWPLACTPQGGCAVWQEPESAPIAEVPFAHNIVYLIFCPENRHEKKQGCNS